MGFIGLVGEPGIVGEKVSVHYRGKPSELAFFHQEKSQWASELRRLYHLPLVLPSLAFQEAYVPVPPEFLSSPVNTTRLWCGHQLMLVPGAAYWHHPAP